MTTSPHGAYVFDGESAFNYGEYLKAIKDSSIEYHTIEGNASCISSRFTITGASTRYIRFHVPANTAFYVYTKNVVVSQGIYNLDIITGTPPTTETGTTTGVYSQPMNRITNPSFPIVTYINAATPTNINIIELDKLYSVNASAQSGGITSLNRVFRIYEQDFYIKIEKTDSGDGDVAFAVVGWTENL